MNTSVNKPVAIFSPMSRKTFVYSNNEISALGSLNLQAAGHPFLINSPQQLREVSKLIA